jgi:hypothetical protein
MERFHVKTRNMLSFGNLAKELGKIIEEVDNSPHDTENEFKFYKSWSKFEKLKYRNPLESDTEDKNAHRGSLKVKGSHKDSMASSPSSYKMPNSKFKKVDFELLSMKGTENSDEK